MVAEMKVAILESIIMPAGHEVEFDRILFKIKYNAKTEYLNGGEVVTYAGANKLQKLFLSLKREYRRKKWFESACLKSQQGLFDALIIPTATYRYLRTLLKTNLKKSPVPVYFIFHGINPHEKVNFVKYAKKGIVADYPIVDTQQPYGEQSYQQY